MIIAVLSVLHLLELWLKKKTKKNPEFEKGVLLVLNDLFVVRAPSTPRGSNRDDFGQLYPVTLRIPERQREREEEWQALVMYRLPYSKFQNCIGYCLLLLVKMRLPCPYRWPERTREIKTGCQMPDFQGSGRVLVTLPIFDQIHIEGTSKNRESSTYLIFTLADLKSLWARIVLRNRNRWS
jgi:hypothetical protein